MVEAFNPFAFKVIINKYDHIAIYFIVWGSSLYTRFDAGYKMLGAGALG